MQITLNIEDALLINYAGRSTVGFTAPVDEDGNELELTEDELNTKKIEFALGHITEEVNKIVVRPAEIDLKKQAQEELSTKVAEVKAQVANGATIEVLE